MDLFDENSLSKAFAQAASSLEMPNSYGNKGTLGVFIPADILKSNLAPAEKCRLACTSTFFKILLKEDLAFYNHLREVLRNEKSLYPLPGNDDASAAATQSNRLTPSQESDLNHVLALFAAYQDYFNHYLAMYQQYADSDYKTWPTDRMEELGHLYASIQEKEKALPIKLIQGTGLGVLQATAQYLNCFASMANDNNELNRDELDRLVVQGLGGAQKAAGDSIVDLYFRGRSMSDPSRRDSCSWARNLNSNLGSIYFLLILWGDPALKSCWPGLVPAPYIVSSSLSLIEVLTPTLDYSLRREVSADENDQAPPSP